MPPFRIARALFSRMPAKPRWLLAIPDAIGQLEELDRPVLTRRRDLKRLFGRLAGPERRR